MNIINAKKLSTGILPLFVLMFIQISANAQIPIMRGDWAGYYPDGKKSPYVWRVVQSNLDLSFEDVGAGTKTKFTGEIEASSLGKITDSNKKTGIISVDKKTITWSDGAIWRWQSALPSTSLNGDWAGYYPNGTKSPFVWRVVHTDGDGRLRFEDVGGGTKTKFEGQEANGKITDSNKKTGSISDNYKTITWSDGAVWRWQSDSPATAKFPDTYKSPGELWASKPDPPKEKIIFPRFSYDNNPYIPDPTNPENPWKWNGPRERTIYNPLDGGVLLKYSFTSQGNADGCSAGAAREKVFFQQACFAHDTNYDAPFPEAGFPGGLNLGQAIADYLFFKDMQLTNDNARGSNNALDNFSNDAAANVFYRGVTIFGKFRGGKSVNILDKGGVVAVYNNSSAFTIVLRVSWKSPDGTYKQEQVTKLVRETAVIPLSVGAREIRVECWMLGGSGQIITATYPYEGMIAYTVTGSAFNPKAQEGLN